MKNLKLAIAILAVSIGGEVHAQDLLSKVPAESKLVVGLNGKGFFKHADVNQLNEILKRTKIFKNISEENSNFNSENIEEFGIDLNAKAYLHFNVNDSIQYFGALIPLKDKTQFESILPTVNKIEIVNGLNTVYSEDRRTRLSWDQQTLYVLVGTEMPSYFSREDIKEKYGLLESPAYDYSDEASADVVDVDSVDWGAWGDASAVAVDSVYQEEEEGELEFGSEEEVHIDPPMVYRVETDTNGNYLNVPPPVGIPPTAPGYIPPPSTNGEFDSVDSVLEQDEYQDDYYLKYSAVTNHNDSIKNIFINSHVNNLLDKIISGNVKPYKSKSLVNMKDNELARMELVSFDSLISYYYPSNLLYGYMGASPTFNYGYETINNTVVVEGNRLKMIGDVSFDKEMTKYYKAMYKSKMNPKLLTYLNDDALGFMSFNINTEAYLKYMPAIVQRVYGGMDQKIGKIVDLFSTAFDIVVDEKAVAKVFKGDNLFILNGVTQKEVKYIDYEYDDDYNYKEIEKTKFEKIPNYLWMFSSDDTRIFDKIFAILETENTVINHEGIYEIKSGKVDEFAPYIMINKGIVFLGNDMEQLKQIKDNTYQGKAGGRFTSIAKKNKFALLFNTKQIPGIIEDLDIPIERSIEGEVKNLEQYGDLYMISNGMKGNKFNWEAGVDFPNTGKNAIDFLINTLNNISKSIED